MIVTDLIAVARDWINDVASGRYTDSQIVDFLSAAQRHVYQKIRATDQGYFEVQESVTAVTGTQEYALPAAARQSVVTLIEAVTGAGDAFRLARFRHQDIPRPPSTTSTRASVFYLIEDRVGFYPVPTDMASFRITYVRKPSPLFVSRRLAVTGPATFTYATAEPGRIGRLPTSDDDFVREVIRFAPNDGPPIFLGGGEEYRITSHDVAQRRITVTPNLSANVSGAGAATGLSSSWSTVPMMGEEFRDYLVAETACMMAAKAREWQEYGYWKAQAGQYYAELVKSIGQRRQDEPRYIRYIEEDNTNWYSTRSQDI